MRAVSMGLIRRRKQYEAALRHALDFPLGYAQFRGVDEIVRRVEPHHRRTNVLESGRRVVVARCVYLIEEVVRIQVLQLPFHVFLDELVRGILGR